MMVYILTGNKQSTAQLHHISFAYTISLYENAEPKGSEKWDKINVSKRGTTKFRPEVGTVCV